jgi:hypothetical protein
MSVLEMICGYISDQNMLVSYQRQSLETFIATMTVVSRYTYFTFNKQDMPVYCRIMDGILDSTIHKYMIKNIRNSRPVLYYIPTDKSRFSWRSFFHINAKLQSKLMLFEEIVICENPLVPITCLEVIIANEPIYNINNITDNVDYKIIENMENRLIRKFRVMNLHSCTCIVSYFMNSVHFETPPDLRGLYRVKWIEKCFMADSSGEFGASLCFLRSLAIIESGCFLRAMTQSIELRSLRRLWKIEDAFATKTKAERISFTQCHNLSYLGNWFGTNSAIRELETTDTLGIVSVGDHFLYGCQRLLEFSNKHMPYLQSIGANAISYCRVLKSIDLSHSTLLYSIGDTVAFQCPMLEVLDLRNAQLTHIGKNFCYLSQSLQKVLFTPMPGIKVVRSGFMQCCHKLEYFDLGMFPEITKIDDSVFVGCCMLRQMKMRNLYKLETIGDSFLRGADSIKRLDLRGATSLRSIGNECLANSESIEYVNISGLHSLETIGEDFVRNTPKLHTLVLQDLPAIQEIDGPIAQFKSTTSTLHIYVDDVYDVENPVIDAVPRVFGVVLHSEPPKEEIE